MTALTLDLVKQYLRYDDTDTSQTDALSLAMAAGVEWVERHTGIAIKQREFRQQVRNTSGYVSLDYWPVAADPVLTYGDGETMPLRLFAGGRPATVRAASGWPSTGGEPVTITYTAGYENPDDIPQTLLHGVLLYAGMFDAMRDGEDTANSMRAIEAVLWGNRLLTV